MAFSPLRGQYCYTFFQSTLPASKRQYGQQMYKGKIYCSLFSVDKE